MPIKCCCSDGPFLQRNHASQMDAGFQVSRSVYIRGESGSYNCGSRHLLRWI